MATPDPKSPREPRGWAVFLGVALAIFAAALLDGKVDGPFQYDAYGYWVELPATFVRDGHWSFLNLDTAIRGYSAAALYGALRSLTDLGIATPVVVVGFNALVLSAISTVLLPALAALAWPGVRLGAVRRAAIAAALFVFWGGYVDYPITDLPALAAGLAAVVCAARRGAWPSWLAAGLAAGFAINLRPAYLLLAAGVLALAVAHAWRTTRSRDAGPHRGGAALVACVFGVVLVGVPQSVISHHNFGIWSPITGSAANLGDFQLTSGLSAQLYGTYAAPRTTTPRMVYVDPAGVRMLAEEGVTNRQVDGYREYARLAAHHPLVVGGALVRHVVNGLDQRYSTPYPHRLDTGQRRPWRIVGALLFAAALLRLLWPAARRGLGASRNWGPLLAVAVASGTSVVSAMEQRFMLPVFVAALLLVVAPGWPDPRSGASPADRRAFGAALAVVVAVVVICWFVAQAATGQLRVVA